jgi:hypothetical protein
MKTRIINWFELLEGFGAIPLETVIAILSIFTVVAGVTVAITALA